MTIEEIVNLVTAKVGATTDGDRAVCLTHAKNRHRHIYESFDWKAAQDTIDMEFVAGQGGLDVPAAEKVLSARFTPEGQKGIFLDPVTLSYIYESQPETLNQFGKPLYYWSGFETGTHSCAVRIFPAPNTDGTLSLLVKKQFDPLALEPVIPGIDTVLITFTLADMWEYLRQLGKYEIKLKEANDLLAAAQQRDTPSAPKPRTTKNLTRDGVTLVELTDSVCDIIGRWEPEARESVKERLRRNYQILYDSCFFAETSVIARVPLSPDQEQVILPYLFDRVIEVRTNKGGPLTHAHRLQHAEISLYFNIASDIFEQSGDIILFSTLPSIGVAELPPLREKLRLRSDQPANDNGVPVFIKGESVGIEVSETVTLSSEGSVDSAQSYDTPLTISKPDTTGTLIVVGATTERELLRLGPRERERKHLRIWLIPNYGDGINEPIPGTVLVLGKRKMSALIEDGDSPQIRNCQSILINAAAADILNRPGGNPELAKSLAAQAQAQAQILVKVETEQNAFQPQIIPYTEDYHSCL